jgi:hypothetical protein
MVFIVLMAHTNSACVYCSSCGVFIYQKMHTVVEIQPEARVLSEMSCGRVNGSVADSTSFSAHTRSKHIVCYNQIRHIARLTGVENSSR